MVFCWGQKGRFPRPVGLPKVREKEGRYELLENCGGGNARKRRGAGKGRRPRRQGLRLKEESAKMNPLEKRLQTYLKKIPARSSGELSKKETSSIEKRRGGKDNGVDR